VLPHGEIPVKIIDAMISGRTAHWRARDNGFHPEPRPAPPPAAVKPNPAVSIIWDQNPLESWLQTKQAMVRLTDGDAGLAMDLLMACPEGRDLYKRAVQSATQAEAKRRKTWSVCPSEIPGL
jgi:hypothetical protein